MSIPINQYRAACSHYEALRERCTDDDKVLADGRLHLALWCNMSKNLRNAIIRDNMRKRNPEAFAGEPDLSEPEPTGPAHLYADED